jgi:hypothetical protein
VSDPKIDALLEEHGSYRGTLRSNVDEVVNARYEEHLAGIEDVQTAHVGKLCGSCGSLVPKIRQMT